MNNQDANAATVKKVFYTDHGAVFDSERVHAQLEKNLGEVSLSDTRIAINRTPSDNGTDIIIVEVHAPKEAGRDVTAVLDATMNIALYHIEADKIARINVVNDQGEQTAIAGWATHHDSSQEALPQISEKNLTMAQRLEYTRTQQQKQPAAHAL
ncbi:MAG: hypothetical protein EAY65_07475 [Alphaproteobacteria bacterium]|nr:MAG: hypothetical protein EAY65_07475 [Alphaproteobacteria bacterium]